MDVWSAGDPGGFGGSNVQGFQGSLGREVSLISRKSR